MLGLLDIVRYRSDVRKILKITHHLVASGDIKDGLVADI